MDKSKMPDDEIIDKYMKAGDILSRIRNEIKDKIKVGVSLLSIAEYVEQRTIELGGLPAFPCNISRNDEAAHATPLLEDKTVFADDVVKIDIGIHVDGYIADSAITFDLTSENSKLVKASEEALYAAIDIIKSGVNTAQIGEVIENTIVGYGFKPVSNLTGHGVAQYLAHVPPSIPNYNTVRGATLKVGDCIAIEPFATSGAAGKIANGTLKEIFQVIGNKPVRLPAIRKVRKELEQYKTLPFAKRWLKSEKLDYSLMALEKAGIITSYHVLKDVDGGLISQAEHTVIVTEDDCIVTT